MTRQRLQLRPPAREVVRQRLEEVRRRIENAGGDPSAVRIVAVTKGFSSGAVEAALAAGIDDIGENYPEELIDKRLGFERSGRSSHPTWHFLGAIQRRRVKDLAGVVDMWQTVSRVEEAEAISKCAPGARVMVEVDSTGIAGRNGCAPLQVGYLAEIVRGLDLDLRGLMTIGPPGPPDESRNAFRMTSRLAAELGLSELSMGMTDDLEVAVEEGTTMLRVGRALFGERESP